MPLADVELTISRRVDGSTTVSMRVELPSHRVDPVRSVPITLTDDTLTALTLSPDVYGAALTAMVFPPALREAWREARAYADGRGEALRVRLTLDGDDTLHSIRWELLRDPTDDTPLAYSEWLRLSRFLPTVSYRSPPMANRPELRAVIALANPRWLPKGLHPVDVASEVARAQHGLGNIPTTLLDGRNGRPAATIPAIITALRDEAYILYLVCHGTLIDGQPYLYLERESGEPAYPVAGSEFFQAITNLERRPLLAILASCHGAGDTYQMLAVAGPQLARVGVGAVLAIQGNAPIELVTQLIPKLFAELQRDGQIDRALVAARLVLPPDYPWWMPALWTSVRDGALWVEDEEPPFVSIAGLYPSCHLRIGHRAVAADLHSRLLAAAERRGSAVLLDSPPGYGKFALVRELAAACVGLGGVVLAADLNFPPGVKDAESPSSVAVPPGLADQLAAAWSRGASMGAHWLHLMAQAQVALEGLLVPSGMGIDDDPGALVVALAQAAYSRPVLLILEHWEHVGTAWDTLLGELIAAMCDPLRLLVVLTRDRAWGAADAESSALGQGRARGGVARHALRRVSSDDLAAAFGPAHLDLLDRLHQLSGGHPALALALWEEWRAVGAVALDTHGVAQPTSADSPWVASSMRELVVRLLGKCLGASPPIPLTQIRRALAVAALEGPTFTVPAVAEVAGLETDDLLDLCDDYLLDDNLDARILVEIGPVPQPEELIRLRLDRYGFALPYLHLVFARELSDTELVRDALRLAQSLERHYQPAPERIAVVLASLFALGGDEARAAPYREQDDRDQRDWANEEVLRWTIASLVRQGLGQTRQMVNAQLDLARWLYEHARYANAVREVRITLALADELGELLQIARACSLLGVLLRGQGDLASARPNLERALAISEQVLGSQHPNTALNLNNLGTLLQAQGRLASARPYFERALTIFTALVGLGHPVTQIVQQNLAMLNEPQESPEQQIARLISEAEAEVERLLSFDDAEQKANLAATLERQAQWAEGGEAESSPHLALAARLRALARQLLASG